MVGARSALLGVLQIRQLFRGGGARSPLTQLWIPKVWQDRTVVQVLKHGRHIFIFLVHVHRPTGVIHALSRLSTETRPCRRNTDPIASIDGDTVRPA